MTDVTIIIPIIPSNLWEKKNHTLHNHIPLSPFNFCREYILVGNLPFQNWFFKQRSWWSGRVL